MLVTDANVIEATLRRARTIAVLGIKPESRRHLDAHDIPKYLQAVGYAIVPVLSAPARYAECERVLGERVRRSLAEITEPIDVLNVWIRKDQLAAYVSDIIALEPRVVWVQSGLLDSSVERALIDAGLTVIEDCIGCRRASIEPAWEKLR